MCGNNKLGRRYNFRFKHLLKRTIPSYQLHPLRTSYYILSSTIPYTQPLPSILSPPYHPHSTHLPCLYLSISPLINYTRLSSPLHQTPRIQTYPLSPYLVTPPLTPIVPFLLTFPHSLLFPKKRYLRYLPFFLVLTFCFPCILT